MDSPGLMDVVQPEMLAVASLAVVLASVLLLFTRHYFSPTVAKAAPAVSGPCPSARGSVDASGTPKKTVLLLYGTQTGTAERFAKQIASEVTARYGDRARAKAVDVEDWDYKEELPKVFATLRLYEVVTRVTSGA